MKLKIAGWCLRLARWLHPTAKLLWVHRDEILDLASKLVKDVDALDMSGEAKRHQVYARLIKAFPAVSKRQLALTIEAALEGL